MDSAFMKRIVIASGLLGLLVASAFLATSGVAAALSALAGIAIGVLNFAAIRYVVSNVVRPEATESGSGAVAVLYVVKFMAIAGAVYLLVAVVGIDAMAFAAGFGAVIIAMTVVGATMVSTINNDDVTEIG